jgi:hypothetical protein
MFVSFRSMIAGLALVAACLVPGLGAPPTHAQEQSTDEPPPPWELTDVKEGEPYWAPLLRLRDAESQYRDTRWWGAYLQMKAFVEAGVGNHAAALAAWDAAFGGPDSVGVLRPGTHATDAVNYLSAVADTARVIMINERHHASSDRLLTLALLPVLREKGYRYFAAEAFDPGDTGLNARPYPTEASGAYIGDPVFAEIVREALRLGYTLVAYESTGELEEGDDQLTPQQQRDIAQARNLARATVEKDLNAKVLVHAGYSHVLETATERFYPMALYFREMTGIDPVTVDQTRLSERSDPSREHPAYRACVQAGLLDDGPVVLTRSDGTLYSPADFDVDVQVFTPQTHYAHGRPDWMTLGGRRSAVEVDVPEGKDQWCLVEARVPGEPPESIPLDRHEVNGTSTVWLFVPDANDVVIRIMGANGGVLRTDSRRR